MVALAALLALPGGTGLGGYRSGASGPTAGGSSGATLGLPGSPLASSSYEAMFSETGLPAATKWTVSLNVTDTVVNVSSTTSALNFSVPNGTFAFIVPDPSNGGVLYSASSGYGNVTVNGANASVPVTFNVATVYGVSVSETGLPAGTTWSVDLSNDLTGSLTNSTTGGSIGFRLPNGTYLYSVTTSDTRYSAPGGSFQVNGTSATEPIVFRLVTYVVTFTETGLPGGTTWYVNVSGGPSLSGTTASLTTPLPNGSYPYTVAMAAKEYTAKGGTLQVNGGPVTKSVPFTLVTYTVTFVETGLPAGTMWYANISGEPFLGGTGTSLTTALPNGSYTYTLATTDKSYAAAAGSFHVTGAPVPFAPKFHLVTYAVTFTETGLPKGTTWYVGLSGGSLSSSPTDTITFNESNGTYSFIVTVVGHWAPSAATIPVAVAGAAVPKLVAYSYTYAIVFERPAGTPSGESWSVSLSGSTLVATASGPATTLTTSSNGATITFDEPNGTYTSWVLVSKHSGYNSSGSFTIDGAGRTITPAALPGGAGTIPYLLYGIVAGAAVLAAVLSAFFLRRRHRPAAPSPPPAPVPGEVPAGPGTEGPPPEPPPHP